MTCLVSVSIPNCQKIILEINGKSSPNTTQRFIEQLPFSVILNVWGEEIYTNELPIEMPEENAKSVVNLNDIAYWPPGKAICLFFGHTPISKKEKILPASPVNIIGRILNPNKFLVNVADGKKALFQRES